MPAGFVTRTGLRRLPDLMRYLLAVDRRLQQMPTSVQRDTSRMEKVHEMQDEYAWLLEQMPQGRPVPLHDAASAARLPARPQARIEPLLPDRTPKRGGRWRDHRELIAIAWKFRT